MKIEIDVEEFAERIRAGKGLLGKELSLEGFFRVLI